MTAKKLKTNQPTTKIKLYKLGIIRQQTLWKYENRTNIIQVDDLEHFFSSSDKFWKWKQIDPFVGKRTKLWGNMTTNGANVGKSHDQIECK